MFFLKTGPAVAARQVEQNMAQLHDPRTTYERTFRFQRYDGGNWQWVADTEVEEANGYAVLAAFTTAQAKNCELIRDIFGNPFRPAALDPAWLTAPVLALALAAYEERTLPAGTLDASRLAVLADALEEAGCDNAEVLMHLRSPGPHVRGCFPVDLILGKR
jgi:hypothetical protein